MTDTDRRSHWDAAYAQKPETEHSWFQKDPQQSLALISSHASGKDIAIIDVGAGASRLADALLERGFADLTLLDLSGESLDLVRQRLGDRGARVAFVTADITDWTPPRSYDLWHDRAVFHFLTELQDQESYLAALRRGTHAGSTVIIATFAPDGPQRCSGLPVQRYSAEDLATRLGSPFVLTEARGEVHVTPAGREQSFTVAVFRRA